MQQLDAFVKMFREVAPLENSISLMVTRTRSNRDIIKRNLTALVTHNRMLTDDMRSIIQFILARENAIHVFPMG